MWRKLVKDSPYFWLLVLIILAIILGVQLYALITGSY